MSYVVLARKYRPKQFAELVGQQHVATTLLNAFKQNKIGQAYLFTGTRGVGKTSAARIFAKALRCEDPEAQPGGKNRGTSCEKCPSCLEINAGNSMDVLEIDGASNNGVESVREIREQVKFLPSRGTMKVYIIDEVHMLSNAAFNALLKTLEEPPPHVTFIFATTEVQKIPATILSRCQRFDFKRVPLPLILGHLQKILQTEEISSEPEALRLIAQKADGSVRDALSALDQCLAFAEKKLTVKDVTESLGIVSSQFLIDLLGSSFSKELKEAMELVQRAFLQGVDIKLIAVSLADTLRNTLLVKLNAEPALMEFSEEEKNAYTTLGSKVSSEVLQAAYRTMISAAEEISRSPLPKASLEMALVRLAGLAQLKTLEQFLAQVEHGSHATPLGAGTNTTPSRQTKAPAKVPTSIADKVEKKNPEVEELKAAQLSPPNNAPLNFHEFVRYVLKHKPNIGVILEHAISVTPEPEWPSAPQIKIGFKKSQGFYQLQAQYKANFEQLTSLLHSFTARQTMLAIETLPDHFNGGSPVTIVEKESVQQQESMEAKKQRFLAHEIVKNTKEIFGAELTSFDIDKAKA